jgi:sigma-B regulation protein RsbU (phosphoserine phosphatase)
MKAPTIALKADRKTMKAGSPPRILLCMHPAVAEDLRGVLERIGCEIAWHAPEAADPADLSTYRLIVVDSGPMSFEGSSVTRRLRARLGDRFVPILCVTPDRQAGWENGADVCLSRPFTGAEFSAQVTALLRIKDLTDRLADKAAEAQRIHRRLQQAYQQIDQELELAQRIQRSFLPQSLPVVPGVQFAVHYCLRGRVGGDFYDVFRLDEKHVGFYVADAMGHGVPASLLTIFLKNGVRAKEVFGQQYRLVPPSEVLGRLNHALLEQALSENPFITMVYALFNHEEGTLSFARAGHPYPLHVPLEGEPALWQVEGSLLGVFDTLFPMQTHQLRPGDKLLFFSDGMDAAHFEHRELGQDSLRAWATHYRDLPIQEFVERLTHDLFREKGRADDLTVLGLEMRA